MIARYLEAASSYAKDIDFLILLIAAIVGFWFLVAQGVFFGLIFKFSAKEGKKAQYISGEEPHQKRWVAIPHYAVLVFDVLIIVAAIRVWVTVKQDMPTPDSTVRIVSQQWAWTFVHPGPDNKLDTADDIRVVDELHVEKDKTYHFELQSKDVLHSFSVPAFRLKQDAVPGRTIKGWFKPIVSGGFDIQCAEICGIGHGIMAARVMVETPAQHREWMSKHSSVALSASSAAPANQVPPAGTTKAEETK